MDSLRWSGAGSHPQENALRQGTKKHCLGDCTISAPYAPKKMPLRDKEHLIYAKGRWITRGQEEEEVVTRGGQQEEDKKKRTRRGGQEEEERKRRRRRTGRGQQQEEKKRLTGKGGQDQEDMRRTATG